MPADITAEGHYALAFRAFLETGYAFEAWCCYFEAARSGNTDAQQLLATQLASPGTNFAIAAAMYLLLTPKATATDSQKQFAIFLTEINSDINKNLPLVFQAVDYQGFPKAGRLVLLLSIDKYSKLNGTQRKKVQAKITELNNAAPAKETIVVSEWVASINKLLQQPAAKCISQPHRYQPSKCININSSSSLTSSSISSLTSSRPSFSSLTSSSPSISSLSSSSVTRSSPSISSFPRSLGNNACFL